MKGKLLALCATVFALTVGTSGAMAMGVPLPPIGTGIDQSHNSANSPETNTGNVNVTEQGGKQSQTATGGTATSGDASSGGGPACGCKEGPKSMGHPGGGEASSEADASAENKDQNQSNTNSTNQSNGVSTVNAPVLSGNNVALSFGNGEIDQSHNSANSPETNTGNVNVTEQGGKQSQTATGGTATSGDASSGGGPACGCKEGPKSMGHPGGGEASSEADASAENKDQNQSNTNSTNQSNGVSTVNAPVLSGNNVALSFGNGEIDQSHNSANSPETNTGNVNVTEQGGKQSQTATGGTATSGDASSGGGPACGCKEGPKSMGHPGGGEASSEADASAENKDQNQSNTNSTNQSNGVSTVNAPVLSGNNVALAFPGHEGNSKSMKGKQCGCQPQQGGGIDQSYNSANSPSVTTINANGTEQGGRQTQSATGGHATSGNAQGQGGGQWCGCKDRQEKGGSSSKADASATNKHQNQENHNETNQKNDVSAANAPVGSGNNLAGLLGIPPRGEAYPAWVR